MTTEQTVRNILEEKGFIVTNKTQKFKDDLGMDSLDIVELVMEVEKEFGIDLLCIEDRMDDMTVQEFISEVQKLKQ